MGVILIVSKKTQNPQNKEVINLDKYKLEYFIKRKNLTRDDLCTQMGLSKSALYRKCKGITEFTRSEILKLVDILDLSGQDILDIFFTQKVS